MNYSRLDEFMKRMPERGIPGCELAVSVDGKTVYRTGAGFADAAKTRPVSDKDLYWLYSATSHNVLIDPENQMAYHYATHLKGCNYGSRKIHPKIRDLVYEGLRTE